MGPPWPPNSLDLGRLENGWDYEKAMSDGYRVYGAGKEDVEQAKNGWRASATLQLI